MNKKKRFPSKKKKSPIINPGATRVLSNNNQNIAPVKDDKTISESTSEELFILFSYDLVNSTAYKQETDSWPIGISSFYQACQTAVPKEIPGAEVLKYVGDEVFFFYPISSFSDAHNAVSKIWRCISEIKSQFLKTIDGTDAKVSQSRVKLDIKSNAWCTRSSKILFNTENLKSTDFSKFKNIYFSHNVQNQNIKDFLGPDFDTGARISRFSMKGFLSLSIELALLIISYAEQKSLNVSNVKLVEFQELKGVWSGRPYPIIMYHEKWDAEDTFDYDDEIRIKWISEYKKCDNGEIYPQSYIKKAYIDIGREDDLIDMEKYMNHISEKNRISNDENQIENSVVYVNSENLLNDDSTY